MPRGEGELDPARLRAELAQLAPTDQIRVLRDLIARQVRDVLGAMAPDGIDTGLSFQNLGFDSRSAVELRDRLRVTTGVELTAAVAFDYPTIERMAQLLHIRLTGLELGEADTDAQAVTAPEEPIAIIGLACRYPGGIASPEDLWQMLADERDVVSDFPTDRGWADIYDPEPGSVGKSYVRSGGFLYDAPLFDAAFFDISPREATAMDPQQRLLLEVAWEAVEHARIAPTSLRGTRTGVYAGQFYTDYADDDAPPELHGYLMTGVTGSVASGRISYALGLEGPAVTVDTACSSSLVTLHLAAQALRRGECEMALAAGVTVMPKPKSFIGFSLQRGLAPDGRCKSYGAEADGTVWSEGVGVLVLERLSQAQRRGRRILAVIRGSAVNQDGASNGLAAPHGPAQERLIRAALADAGIGGADVDVVEGHGTGTVLGDPIEVQALLSTYGRARGAAGPLWLGSVKSNMGHTQAAAGVAGVIKTVMAMRHEIMPRTLYADHRTEHVNWGDGQVQVLAAARPWPRRDRARRAGISSFGISGTNAHVIIEEPPREPATTADRSEPPLTAWVLCARDDTAVSAQAGRLLTALREHEDLAPVDIGYSLAVTRAEFARRSVLLGTDRTGLLEALEVLAEDGDSESVVRGVADRDARTALLFPGQGAQRPGMGRRLYDAYPLFAEIVDEMCVQFDAANPHWEAGLRAVLFAAPGTPAAELLDETGYTQPALFTIEVALFRLMCSWGVRPDYVAGHSIGEIAAAYVAGVWSLTDACALVAARGRLMQALPRGGAMLAAEAAEEDVAELLAERTDRISLAAVNSPRSLVLSGDEDAVAEVAALLGEGGTRTKRLIVSHAFHSPCMEPMLAEFRRICAGLTYHGAAIPVISTVTGTPLTDDELRSPDYWVNQVRRPVRFLAATRRLLGPEGVSVLWEVGPGTVLTGLVHRTASDSEVVPTAAPMLREPGSDGEPMDLLRGLSLGYCAGAQVDWAGMFTGAGAHLVDLPTYAFQRQRYWLEPVGGGDVRGAGLADADHPLLGALVELPDTETLIWTGLLSLRTHPWLADHDIAGNVLLPGTAYVDIALYAGTAADCPHLAELVLQAPLVLPESGALELRVVVGATQEDGSRSMSIHSRPQSESDETIEWSCHAEGVVQPESEPIAAPVDFAVWPPSGAEKVELDGGYDRLADRGYRYGPLFRGLTALWRRGEELFAEVDLPEQARGSAERFGVHPALLDAALHALALRGPTLGGDEVSVPFSWEGVTLHAVGADSLRVRLTTPAPDRITLTLADPAGSPVAEVAALALRTLPRSALTAASAVGTELLIPGWTALARSEIADAVAWDSGDSIETVTLGDRSARVLRADFHGDGNESETGTPEFVRERVAWLLSRVQPLLAADSGEDPLVVVTRHAVALYGAEVADLTGAAAWGLLRSAQTENPGRLLLVDTDEWENYRDAVAQALASTGEPQLAVRDGLPHTARLSRAGTETMIAEPPGDAPWRLRPRGRGTLTPDNLALVADEDAETSLLPGQVRIEVRTAGVNFRDVLIVLGMYPDPDAGIGGEGAGVVVEVAPDITEFEPGDRVFGFIPAVASTAVVDRRLVAPMPRGWTFAQAAAAPVVFATAYYGLVDLAELEAGEKLLLHAATGGVGMAASQLARHLGAELYVTASKPKWNVLRDMGFDDDHVGDSRSLDFESRFTAATGGSGVDVVLDSLAGEFVDASLRLLPRGGRFIEMGMTDRREPEQVAAGHPGVRYRSFHLMEAGPDRLREILTILADLFESGALQPIPTTCWHVREAAETLRFMSQARHIGKNVLALPVPWRPDGTVLITGGTGGLGAVIARHLVTARGVRRLVLASRRGPAATGAAELAAELTEHGAEVSVVATDLSEPQAISTLLSEIPADHPLTAVVHAAGVLDDAVFESLTADQFATVFKPKVDAAWRLHEATVDADLAAFVLYSSVAGVLGGPGQANYAAANAFIDALARQRRVAGLPATAVAWGAWRGSNGMTAELSDQDWARMRRQGMRPIDDAHGVALFDAALAGANEAVVAARWDTAALSAQDPADIPPPLRGLARAPRRTAAARSAESAKFIAGLAGMDPAEQGQTIVDALRVQAAAVLGHRSPDAIDPTRPFQELGFDSLGVMEFRNRLKSALGIALAATVVFDHPTPAALAEYLRQEIVPVDDAPARLRAGIEGVARGCAAAQLGPEDRRDLAVRLRAVVRELDAGVDGVSVDLDTADDRELFGLIDQLD
ncbi:type I polyketide synthase [Nocardia uniformis]|uniref:Type I polyketide synthase n=1 Tax=Nocardia uniformis TaxID=53432 RepID=A0A849BYV1_9NOCA|nr:type I polyketide synthase [Nocardia uniformis]NNH68847.1 type I polyketide synthase [Nocardia uniformis]